MHVRNALASSGLVSPVKSHWSISEWLGDFFRCKALFKPTTHLLHVLVVGLDQQAGVMKKHHFLFKKCSVAHLQVSSFFCSLRCTASAPSLATIIPLPISQHHLQVSPWLELRFQTCSGDISPKCWAHSHVDQPPTCHQHVSKQSKHCLKFWEHKALEYGLLYEAPVWDVQWYPDAIRGYHQVAQVCPFPNRTGNVSDVPTLNPPPGKKHKRFLPHWSLTI